MRLPVIFVLAAAAAFGQAKYSGPRPEKADVPYIVQAGKLLETEIGEAREAQSKNEAVYSVAGASSPVKTPLAEPVMIMKADKLNPDRLQLYRMEVKDGQRILRLGKTGRNAVKPVFLMVSKLQGDLWKVEVNEPTENGEYCISPEGSNQVFCFAIY
jgi:hypothetical protein